MLGGGPETAYPHNCLYHQAHERALRLAAVHASQAQLRDEHAAQREFIRILLEQQKASRNMRYSVLPSNYTHYPHSIIDLHFSSFLYFLFNIRLQELLGNVAVVALGASTALLPPVLLTRMAPIVRNTPIALSVLGVWRVAQRSVKELAGLAINAVKDLVPLGEAASISDCSSGCTGDPVTPAFG